MPMDGMWTFLLVGTFGAIGAAMAVGTAAALVRYHRRGEWPGVEGPAEVSRGRLVGLYARVVIGASLAGYAFISLSSAGLIL
jgi:hypothetical protein